VDDPGVGLGEAASLCLVGPHAVGEGHLGAGDAHVVEVRDVALAGSRLDRFDLLARLARVSVNAHTLVGVREFARAAETVIRAGDGKSRRDGVPDTAVCQAVISLAQALALGQRLRGVLLESVRRVPVHQNLPEARPDPDALGGPEDDLRMVDRRVVQHRRRAALDAFEVPEKGADLRRLATRFASSGRT